MYHSVIRSPLQVYEPCFLDEASFRRQMHYLRNHFDVLSLSEAVDRIGNGGFRRPSVAVTFDDGFQNNYEVAFPILREFQLPVTIFLTTGLIDSDDTVWFCRLNQALAVTNLRVLEWQGQQLDLSQPESKSAVARLMQERLKRLPHPALLRELDQLVSLLGDDPRRSIEQGSPFRMLTHSQIKEMVASGLVEFGAHTHNHAILSRLSHEDQAREIKQSIAVVEVLTGKACALFAYPNGGENDYDRIAIGILQGGNVKAAVTTIVGPNDHGTPPLELRRYGVPAGRSLAYFELLVHHVSVLTQRMTWRRAEARQNA